MIRLHNGGSSAQLVGALCPDCGSLLEPVRELAEVVGFRSIKTRDGAADAESSDRHERIADRVDDFLSRRESILARDRFDAEQWLDDGGSFRADAVALPRPETSS
jgi:hypothetical protein